MVIFRTYHAARPKGLIIELVSRLCKNYSEKVKSIFAQNDITKTDLIEVYDQSDENFKAFIDSLEEDQITDPLLEISTGLYLSNNDLITLDGIIKKHFRKFELVQKIEKLC